VDSVSRSSYYRWLGEKAWTQEKKDPVRPVQMFEALAEERQAVLGYALEHPEVRHRESRRESACLFFS
jgi:hypothetical protein